jgi:hypothetical protein
MEKKLGSDLQAYTVLIHPFPFATMALFRQYIAPLIVVLIFMFSLLVVSARIFLPQDMAAPAPVEEEVQPAAIRPDRAHNTEQDAEMATLPPELDRLVRGTSDEFGISTSL